MRVPVILFVAAYSLSAAAANTVPADFLDALTPEHPRLMLTDPQLADLKEVHAADTDLQRMWAQVQAQAEEYLDAPALKHELKGPRLLSVSRECLKRVYTLGMAYRWSGDAKYANAAVSNLKTVCAFPDWNPSHFLDTAEMSHAVGVGYDWLYDYMDEAMRSEIRAGLIKHGMEEGLKVYAEQKFWWLRSEFNWNQVCNSGLLIGALAIAETDPIYAESIVPGAVASLPRAIKAYDPDGVWTEGPAYWHYATRYTAYGLSALESALGTTFGLTEHLGLAKTAWFPVLTAGPTGLYLNFADAGQNSQRKPMATLFWLARTYDMPGVTTVEHNLLESEMASASHLVWYQPRPSDNSVTLPLDQFFDSTVQVAVSRSAWNDRDALFVGVKAGYNQVNHGHLDLGNFEFDALGNRWARDLGSDNYNLPGYWDRKRGGKRWTYYRMNSLSHNVPLIDGKGQDPEGTAEFLRQGLVGRDAFCIVDLGKAYELAGSVMRGVTTLGNRRAVAVRDEFVLKEPLPVAWAMTTDAEISIDEPQHATLRQNGKELVVTIEPGATFRVESAEQEEPQHNNRGVKRLIAETAGDTTTPVISVFLRPVWPEGGALPIDTLPALADW